MIDEGRLVSHDSHRFGWCYTTLYLLQIPIDLQLQLLLLQAELN